MLSDQTFLLQELGTNAVECERLSHLLQSAYQGRYDANELQQALNQHRDSLSNPLWHKERDNQSMQTIANNRNNGPFQLSDQDLNLINKFSEATNLNQKYILCFLRDARIQIETEKQQQQQRSLNSMHHQTQSNHNEDMQKMRDFIKSAYFNARKLRLKVLRELVVVYDRIAPIKEENKMQQDDEEIYPNELRNIINSSVEYLFSKNFISNLCKSIKDILRQKSNTFEKEFHCEICDCIAIFYAISQRIECNVSDIKSLLRLFDIMTIHNKEFEHCPRIRASSYLLCLCLYQSLDPSEHAPYINPRKQSQIGKNDILNCDNAINTVLNTMINELSSMKKKNATTHCASFLLLIITMIYKIKAKVDQQSYDGKYCSIALRHGALDGLYRDFLDSVCLLEDFCGIREAVYVSLADCFCELFELCDKETRDYYAAETMQKRSKYKERGLQTMLNVLIYLAHHSSAFCDMFIKNASGKSFIEFLDNTADLPTPWFHLYAKFIFELAQNEPHAVYLHITQEKCEKLTIDAIWQILEKAAQLYLPQQMTRMQAANNLNMANNNNNNPYEQLLNEQRNNGNMSMAMTQHEIVWTEPPNMTEMEVRIVCSVLKVLSAMGRIEAVYQQINFQHRPPGIIALLFRLIQCNIPTSVRSNCLNCIGAFAQNEASICDKVWQTLERDQILFTQRQKNQAITKGVELDIIEGEKDGNDAIYPVTVSFCKLLLILLKNASAIPQLLGNGMRGQRPSGIWPYTDYVRDFVFLRWSKREYAQPKEQWELAATSLQIFGALLDKFDASQLTPNANIRYLFTKHPSFELLTLLLAPHSNLIEVILDIFQKAFYCKYESDNSAANEQQQQQQRHYCDDTMYFIESALSNSLNLIRCAIEKEDLFLSICQKYWPQRLSLRPLNSTLLSQQYRSQIISIAKCCDYECETNNFEIASYSLSILSHLNKTQQGITLRSVFTDQINVLQSSFSNQLINAQQNNDSELPDVRVSIIQFLLKSLSNSNGHNLGLMLLSFADDNESMQNSEKSLLLKSIFKICLDASFCFECPALSECCFELLFRLLSHQSIGQRFLNCAERECSSFFISLLRQNLACTKCINSDDDIATFLNQRAWLLRSISFEFHLINSMNKQGILDNEDVRFLGFLSNGDSECDDSQFAMWQIFDLLDLDINFDDESDASNKIWGIDLNEFKQFAHNRNEQRTSEETMRFTWNISKMYFALDRAPQSGSVVDKECALERISRDALLHNQRVSMLSALERGYDSWSELIRCVLSMDNVINYSNMNNQLLLRLLDKILERLSHRVCGSQWSTISNILSQTALNIMFYFRQSLKTQFAVQISAAGMRTILEGIICAILSQQNVRNARANLYASLSSYFHYSSLKIANVFADADEQNSINLAEKVCTERDELSCMNVAILLAKKDVLLNVIFTDSVSKDAYLSSVSSLILQSLLSEHDGVSLNDDFNMSPPQIWLSMMLEKSRLLFVLKYAMDLDEDIQRALASQRHWYFLYQFESMMNVLIAASAYAQGSNELICNNCISLHLTKLKCLTSRVFWTAYSANANGTQSVECCRYLQLLTPCLTLICSMFAACPNNVRLHYQTLTFFEKHNDIMNKLLTLDSEEESVLRCVKLIVSIWYQLYCGPLYVNKSQHQNANMSARDSTILEHIESKLQIFYFLFKKYAKIAFVACDEIDVDIDNDDDDDNSLHKDSKREQIARQIIRILLNIFRLKSIGSTTTSANCIKFDALFEANLMNSNHKIDDNPPDLRLICDCLKGILPISQECGKWIAEQNADLRQLASNNNVSMMAKLQQIEPMLVEMAKNIKLQCFLVENFLILLYFHCEFYLTSFENDFYHKFSAVVMSEVVQALTDWYQDDDCILHVRQDMIQQRGTTNVCVPKSSKIFIEIMLEKFHILDRDNRQIQMIKN